MQMVTQRDNAEFLHLFSQDQNGLKYLTHDFSTDGDYIDYVYRCQQIVLSCRSKMHLEEGLYSLVSGFIFGPQWVDYNGLVHDSFASSEEFVSYFEQTGKHPLNNPTFAKEIEDFRNSIRFRSGVLDLFVREELSSEFPELAMKVPGKLKGADMYIETGPIREVLRLILKSMREYGDYRTVAISFLEDELEGGFFKSSLSITQVGSFPAHPLSRDMARLAEGDGGTFGTIRKRLKGLCNWDVVTKWPDKDSPIRWRILRDETQPELSEASLAEGFTHILTIIHKP